jgi:hypothetical protein
MAWRLLYVLLLQHVTPTYSLDPLLTLPRTVHKPATPLALQYPRLSCTHTSYVQEGCLNWCHAHTILLRLFCMLDYWWQRQSRFCLH